MMDGFQIPVLTKDFRSDKPTLIKIKALAPQLSSWRAAPYFVGLPSSFSTSTLSDLNCPSVLHGNPVQDVKCP